jgi:mRNA interferase RelE/StbE
MTFNIFYHELVIKNDIPKLTKRTKTRIKNDIEKKLTAYPEKFGKPLRKSLKGYRKLRSGDYRIIFRINEKTIKILLIEHRSVVYKKGIHRLKD